MTKIDWIENILIVETFVFEIMIITFENVMYNVNRFK